MIQTDVFKFVALRPPVSVNRDDLIKTTLRDRREPEATQLAKLYVRLMLTPIGL